jgi:hypothetical protein
MITMTIARAAQVCGVGETTLREWVRVGVVSSRWSTSGARRVMVVNPDDVIRVLKLRTGARPVATDGPSGAAAAAVSSIRINVAAILRVLDDLERDGQ